MITILKKKVYQIVFIWDYIQIGFDDGFTLNVYDNLLLSNISMVFQKSDINYEKLLVSLIGSVVIKVDLISGKYHIEFSNGLKICINDNSDICESFEFWDGNKFV
jgi:hypothetical protein